MVTRKRIELTEEQVARVWQQVIGRELTGTEGQRITVVYPGRINGNGPDFRDAVIAGGPDLMRGDVEVHTRSGDWYRHGHHRDSEYNNIILHVAMWHDCHSATLLQSGRTVPVLGLAQALQHQAYLLPCRLPCFRALHRMDRTTLTGLLKAAGEERFRQKAMRFQSEILRPDMFITHPSAGQVLYRGMMRALGYSKNTKSFEELSSRVPLTSLEPEEGLTRRQALLLGTAGLLPSQRPCLAAADDEKVHTLERIWRSIRSRVEPMSERDWRLSHIYPNNSPVRRIVAQSYLLERYCTLRCREPAGSRLMAGLLELVQEVPAQGPHRALADGLAVTGDGYWQCHFDFGASGRTRTSSLLGNGKTGEILVNVLLPFFFTLGKLAGRPDLMQKTMELHHSYPKLAENEITRHMAGQLGLEGLSGLTACHQQGLIHIFRDYCREGRCSSCPLTRETRPA